jgi:hypothetical protein
MVVRGMTDLFTEMPYTNWWVTPWDVWNRSLAPTESAHVVAEV